MEKEELNEIWREVKRNAEIRNNCSLHNFIPNGNIIGLDYICTNCGCKVRVDYVLGYKQGLEHGKGVKDSEESRS